MIKRMLLVMVLLAIGLVSASVSVADEMKAAIPQMAEIMHRLKHFPSPQGKATLQSIIDNSSTSANERTLASAMMNLQHHAVSSDIPKLKAVIADDAASQQERDLATIILNLNHRPTRQDKAKLKAMMQ
jgi:hypothetical protein